MKDIHFVDEANDTSDQGKRKKVNMGKKQASINKALKNQPKISDIFGKNEISLI
jgi:hypothetical protein